MRAIAWASVVLPVPGGPQRMTDDRPAARWVPGEAEQRRSGGEQMPLPGDLVEAPRTHPHRERRGAGMQAELRIHHESYGSWRHCPSWRWSTEGGSVASSKNEQRQARERLRRFTARQTVHAHQQRRRRRDNILAVAGVLVVIALAAATQVYFFTAGPGARAAATPSPSASPSAQTGQNVGDIPALTLSEHRQWSGTLTFNDVPLGISLDGAAAPQAVAVFVQEVRAATSPARAATGSPMPDRC